MEERILEQIKKLAKESNYDEVTLNFKEKKPLVIEGIKGSFMPEILLYKKRKVEALVSFIEDLESIEEVYKLTLFIDYTSKKNLFLYILYDPKKISEKDVLKKLKERNVKLPENAHLISIL